MKKTSTWKRIDCTLEVCDDDTYSGYAAAYHRRMLGMARHFSAKERLVLQLLLDSVVSDEVDDGLTGKT